MSFENLAYGESTEESYGPPYNQLTPQNPESTYSLTNFIVKQLLWELMLRDFLWEFLYKTVFKKILPYLLKTAFIFPLHDLLYDFILLNLYKACKALTKPCDTLTNLFKTYCLSTEGIYVLVSHFLALGTSLYALGLPSMSKPDVLLQEDYLSGVISRINLTSVLFWAGTAFFIASQFVNALFSRKHLTNTIENFFSGLKATLFCIIFGGIAGAPQFSVGFEDLDNLWEPGAWALAISNFVMYTITRAIAFKELFFGLCSGRFLLDNQRQCLNYKLKKLLPEQKTELLQALDEKFRYNLSATNQEALAFIQRHLKANIPYHTWRRVLFPFILFCGATFVFGFKGLDALDQLDIISKDAVGLRYFIGTVIGLLSGIFYSKTEWRKELSDDTLSAVRSYQKNEPKTDKLLSRDNITSPNAKDLRWITLSSATVAILAWDACSNMAKGKAFIALLLTVGIPTAYGAFEANRRGVLDQQYRQALNDERNRHKTKNYLIVNTFMDAKNSNHTQRITEIRREILLNKDCLPKPKFSDYIQENFWCCKKERKIESNDLEMGLMAPNQETLQIQ